MGPLSAMALAIDAPPPSSVPRPCTCGGRNPARRALLDSQPATDRPGTVLYQDTMAWNPSCRHRADGYVHRPVIIGTPRKARAMRRLRTIGVIVAVGLLAAACGSSGGKSSSSSGSSGKTTASGTLTISNESGGTWTCSFNPFNLSYIATRWATSTSRWCSSTRCRTARPPPGSPPSWAWSNGNKTITFTIRKGVKFTNGTPMTAADVVYTFNLIKKYPALDLNAVWSVLSSVTQPGSNQVVMTFKTAGGAVLLLHRRPGRRSCPSTSGPRSPTR